jgi:LysM repeat protein
MGYNPKASCGRQTFKLKSQATAKLYYYTPYVPNASALRNLWGSGDSCGAYGNRNFWRQFWTWFGSPVAGGYILKSTANQTFLVNQDSNKRYQINQDSIISDFKPLGPIGTVSEAYLASFADAGELKSVITSASGKRFMIANGFKYPLGSSTQAANLALDWATASVLTDVQIDNFSTLAFGKSLTSGEIFLLDGSMRRLVSSPELYKTLSVIGGTATFTDEFLSKFTLGSPATGLIQNSVGARFGIFDGKRIELSTSSQASALGYDWNQATLVTDPTMALIASATFIKSTSTPFLVKSGKKHSLSSSEYASISKFGGVATVSADTLSKFQSGPPMNGLIRTSSETYLVTGGAKYRIVQSQVTAINAATGSRMDWVNVVPVSTEQANLLPAPVMMKPSDSTQNFLVVDNSKKHPISTSNLRHFAKLGTVGTVPAAYLNTIESGSNPDRFVRGADGFNYYLSDSSKYRVSSASVAKAFAPSTFPEVIPNFNNLPMFTATQLGLYATPSTAALTTYVKSATEKYLIQNGERREVLDENSLVAALGSLPATSVLTPALVSHLPLGDPIYLESSLISSTDGALAGIAQGRTFFEVPKPMLPDIKASAAWQIHKPSGTLSSSSIARLVRGTPLAPFVTAAGRSYLLSSAGKTLISDPTNIAASMSSVPGALLDKISSSTAATITTPLVVQSASTNRLYLVYSKQKRALVNNGQEVGLLRVAALQNKATWPSYALEALKITNNVFSPGQIVKSVSTGNIYLIDGWDRGWRITLEQAKAFGVSAPPALRRGNFSGYKTTSRLPWQKFICGTTTYVADSGKLFPIETASASHWPGTATVFAPTTCANLTLETSAIGALISYDGKRYQVAKGKLKLIRSTAEYNDLARNRVAAIAVSKSLFSIIPKGNPTSYVVVAGDSLSSVASKFKTSKTVLRTLNNLSTEVLQLGQILALP